MQVAISYSASIRSSIYEEYKEDTVNIRNITLESGYIIILTDSGPPTRYPIADVLRAADIPVGLTYIQITAITALASLIAVLIRTLIDRQVLDESFLENDDLDLDHIIYAIEQMGGAYHEPDISVS